LLLALAEVEALPELALPELALPELALLELAPLELALLELALLVEVDELPFEGLELFVVLLEGALLVVLVALELVDDTVAVVEFVLEEDVSSLELTGGVGSSGVEQPMTVKRALTEKVQTIAERIRAKIRACVMVLDEYRGDASVSLDAGSFTGMPLVGVLAKALRSLWLSR
jgi:hypothetical protein